MHGNSITANAPLVIRTVRMASVSTNVWRSTLLVSSLLGEFLKSIVNLLLPYHDGDSFSLHILLSHPYYDGKGKNSVQIYNNYSMSPSWI